MGSINVRLNGKETPTSANYIIDLLTELNINPAQVIVEVNQVILKHHDLEKQKIKPNDIIEIIRYIGGGQIIL